MEIDTFREFYNSKVSEMNGCSTMDFFSKNSFKLPERKYIPQSDYVKDAVKFTIESDFFEYFKDNDFVEYSTPMDTINNNFINIRVYSSDEAFLIFLEMKYNLNLDLETLDLLRNCYSQSILNELTGWFRNISLKELKSILMYYDTVLKYPGVLKYFSLTPDNTRMLIDLMLADKINIKEMSKFIHFPDKYTNYLLHKYSNSESEDLEEKPVYTGKYAMLSTRDDFKELCNLLDGLDFPESILNEYSGFRYLKQIIVAFSKGIYYEKFLNNYCKGQIDDNSLELVLNEYAYGNFDKFSLEQTQGNFYLTKLLSDLKCNRLQTDRIILVMQDTEKLKDVYHFAVKLVNAVLHDKISLKDYYKYISLVCLRSDDYFITLFNSVNRERILPFNSFCFNVLFNCIYNNTQKFDIPDEIGSFLCVVNKDAKFNTFTTLDILINLDNVIDTIDSFLLGATMQQALMDDMKGIFILQKGISLKISSLAYLDLCSNSFDNYFNSNTYEDYSNYNSETALLNSNFISLKNHVSLHPDFEAFVLQNKSIFQRYDLLFSRLNNDLVNFRGVASSKNFKVYINCLNSLQVYCTPQLIFFYFVNRVIQLLFKADYQFSEFGINELTKDFIIDVIGISGFLNISIKTFIDNIDKILSKLIKLPNIRMVVDKENNKIIVKGWA